MENSLQNEFIKLRPSNMYDKLKVFDWLTNWMLDTAEFPDTPIPSWEQFDKNYFDYFFDGSKPESGRCFLIMNEGLEIGQINYTCFDTDGNSSKLDLWYSDKQYAEQDFGSHALDILCSYLNQTYGITKIYAQVSRKNQHEISLYLKAGFIETSEVPTNLTPEFKDAAVLVKEMPIV